MPYTEPDPSNPDNFSKSLFWPSKATFLGHPRFARLSANIRYFQRSRYLIGSYSCFSSCIKSQKLYSYIDYLCFFFKQNFDEGNDAERRWQSTCPSSRTSTPRTPSSRTSPPSIQGKLIININHRAKSICNQLLTPRTLSN